MGSGPDRKRNLAMNLVAYWINCPATDHGPEMAQSTLQRLGGNGVQMKRGSPIIVSKEVYKDGERYEEHIFFATDIQGARYVAYCCDGRTFRFQGGLSCVGTIILGEARQRPGIEDA
jgi:hypothetical protein